MNWLFLLLSTTTFTPPLPMDPDLKVSYGMSRNHVLRVLGTPSSVNGWEWRYSGQMCLGERDCSVYFNSRGATRKFIGVKPEVIYLGDRDAN